MSGKTFGPYEPVDRFGRFDRAGRVDRAGSFDRFDRWGTRRGAGRTAPSSRVMGSYGVAGDTGDVRRVPGDLVRGLYVVREGQGAGGSDSSGSSEDVGGTGRVGSAGSPRGAGSGAEPGRADGPGLGERDEFGDEAEFAEGAGTDGRDAHGGSGSGNGGGGDRGKETGGGFGGGFGGEDELRRLLQTRVGDLEPAPDALEQLRRAVPARRQRRRHVVVGAAAALLLGGTSIPAMVHVANLNDSSEDRPANAASSQRAPGSTEGSHGEGTEHAFPQPTGKDGRGAGTDKPEGKDGRAREKNGTGNGAGAGTPAPDETMDVTSPVCSRDQLGQGTSSVGAADSAGRVYGAFRVVNTSGTACSIDGGGTVGVSAQGATNADRIHVVDHTSGDEATGLPDPATTPDQLVLKPGEAYEVKFAWIPEAGGGPTGCANPGPSPTPEPSTAPGDSPESGAAATDGGAGQAGGADGTGGADGGGGGAASGGVVLSHTPEAGEPTTADAKITDACAGTVYRTEALGDQ